MTAAVFLQGGYKGTGRNRVGGIVRPKVRDQGKRPAVRCRLSEKNILLCDCAAKTGQIRFNGLRGRRKADGQSFAARIILKKPVL